MVKKSTILFYVKGINEVDLEFQKSIEKSLPQESIEICRTLAEFLARLRAVERDTLVALLLASDKEDLANILLNKPFLSNVKLILILPDREDETVAMGHTLHPRFLSCKDGELLETTGVLRRMLEKVSGPKISSQYNRQSDSGNAHFII